MTAAARLSITATALLLIALPTDLVSCGPFIPYALFVATKGPINPAADYRRHYIGILGRDWSTEAVIMAYRYFSGLDLNEAELKSLYPGKKEAVAFDSPQRTPTAIEQWLDLRKTIPNAPPVANINATRTINKPDQYISFENCLDDSFRNASATLKSRVAAWGAAGEETRDWLTAQDIVFDNCSGPATQPAPAPPNASALLKAARAYQTAAAAFYAGDYTAAHAQFLAIGAPYLAARATLRDATVNANEAQLAEAARELAALNTPAAEGLLQFTNNRLHREDRLIKLSTELSQPRISSNALQTLVDFRFTFLDLNTRVPRATGVNTPLTDWLLSWRNAPDAAAAVTEWRQQKNLPWLIAALASSSFNDAAAPELLAAAAKVEPASPAFPSVSYYAARIAPDPHRWIDRALARSLNDSDHNQLREFRFTLAGDFDDFLRDAPRKVSLTAVFDDDPEPIDPKDPTLGKYRNTLAFASDSVALWNRSVPLSKWLEAANKPILPKNLRTDLARSGWVRAALANLPDQSRAFLTLWSTLNPADAKPALPYLKTPDDFTAAIIFLENPGLAPDLRSGFGRLDKLATRDQFRDNWWCSAEPAQPIVVPTFLPQQPAAPSPSASAFIPAAIVAYAKTHPDDPAMPELLAKSLDVAHYTYCNAKDAGAPSREAFQLLKSRYPKSKWAQQTNYWYK